MPGRGHKSAGSRVLQHLKSLRPIQPAELHEALSKTWVIYHTCAACAQTLIEARASNADYAYSFFRKIALDINNFVLSACPMCKKHHEAQLQSFLNASKTCRTPDYERFVFELHNSASRESGKDGLPESQYRDVCAHYREMSARLGRGITASRLSQSLPTLRSRFCYDC